MSPPFQVLPEDLSSVLIPKHLDLAPGEQGRYWGRGDNLQIKGYLRGISKMS